MDGGRVSRSGQGNWVRMAQIDVPAVVFRISKYWEPGMDDAQVYDVTRGWWVMGRRREGAEYALAVTGGVVRGAYRVHAWRERREGDRGWEEDDPANPRWGFDGEPAPELQHLVGQDVSDRFPRGAANPVSYVNC